MNCGDTQAGKPTSFNFVIESLNKKRRLVFLVAVAVVVAIAFFGRQRFLPPVAAFLDVSTPIPESINFVVPLPGDDNTRTLAAAALLRIGRAERVAILQGVPSPLETDGITLPGAEITRRVVSLDAS